MPLLADAAPRPRPVTTEGLPGVGLWPGLEGRPLPGHSWEVCEPIPSHGLLGAGQGYVRAGERLMLTVALPIDRDHCTECQLPPFCPHGQMSGLQPTEIVAWFTSQPDGWFGHWDGQTFDPNVPPGAVNCYLAGPTPGVFDIWFTLDDDQAGTAMA